jgi:recombination protein RecT
MRCSETGLEPIGAGGAWPVPYFNGMTKKMEVQFIPDWRGLIQLAKKTEQIKHAYGEVVRENDIIHYQKGDNPKLDHEPALKNRGEVMGAYCVVVLPDDSKHIEYMSFEEIEDIRGRSKSKDKNGNMTGPWKTDWAQMAIKTVVRRALKPFSGSPEMQTAIEYDNQATGFLDKTPIAEPLAIEDVSQELPKNKQEENTSQEKHGGFSKDEPSLL